jgi:C-terminal processing protease CtpA/Prc
LSLERQLSLICAASGTDDGIVFRFQLKDTKPYKIDFMTVSGINVDGVDLFSSNATKKIQETINYVANRAQRVDDAMRKETVEKVAGALRKEYLYPEMGKKMADKLIQNLSAGQYDECTRTGKLADKLTEDMVALCKDLHLWVEACNPLHDQSIYPEINRSVEDLRRDNYGFRKTEILRGNIGYIKFDIIHDEKEALEIAASALASVGDCDALIFDIRDNIGGEWGVARLIISYFFKEQTITGHSYDRSGQIVHTEKTLEDIPGKRFDPALPVYILTSNRTGSAAEGFAYTLKHFSRAIIVGETTIGMAHPSKEIVINKLFRISVPYIRVDNAITKTSFENIGVIPHIKVKASKALEAAIEDAKKQK